MPDFYLPASMAHKGIPAAPKGTAYANATRQIRLTQPVLAGSAIFIAALPAFNQRIQPGTWIRSDNDVVARIVDDLTWELGDGTLSPQTVPTVQEQQGQTFAVIEDGTPLEAALVGATEVEMVAIVAPISEIQADAYSPETFGLWVQSVPALTPAVIEQAIERYDRRIRAQGGLFTTPSGVVVTGAAAGFVGLNRRIWVTPTDIGGGADQLPPDPANLTARALENHPTVFVGRSDSARATGLIVDTTNPAAAIVSEPRPLLSPLPEPEIGLFVNAEPLVVAGVPTHALWTVVLDGCLYRGFFEVPDGNPNGLVRPRDLFQATFNASRATGSVPTWIVTFDPVAGPVRATLIRGWERLSYAQCEQLVNFENPLTIGPVYDNEEGRPGPS